MDTTFHQNKESKYRKDTGSRKEGLGHKGNSHNGIFAENDQYILQHRKEFPGNKHIQLLICTWAETLKHLINNLTMDRKKFRPSKWAPSIPRKREGEKRKEICR